MAQVIETAGPAADREIVIQRLINAPRDLVFEVWTKPEHIVHWWGPNGFTTTIHDMDARAGGVWNFIMHGPDGTDFKNRVVFDEVTPPATLRYHHAGEEEHEDIKFQVTVTFEEQQGRTLLRMQSVFETAAELRHVVENFGAVEGGIQNAERMADYAQRLAGKGDPHKTLVLDFIADNQIVFRRFFKAPPQLVYDAFTNCEHLKRWWGPRGHTLPKCQIDLREGGAFKYVMADPDGNRFTMEGGYIELNPPSRIVHWESFTDPMFPPNRSDAVSKLTAEDGGTMLEAVITHDSAENMAATLSYGMEDGARETYERLAEYLEEVQRG